MSQPINRRTFTKAGAALAATALSASRVRGANERIRLGFIGTANRGGQLIQAFKPHADAQIAVLCDVDQKALEKANARLDGKAELCGDFRQVLDRKDIDAVVIATPDHWHALMTIGACRAGKDVYVEKPLSMTLVEGRKMVEAARRYKRVVQVGLHRRSSALYAKAAEMVQANKIGKVTVGRCYHCSNMYRTGMGHAKPIAPPATLNWDMWLGPRPERSFQENIAPYKFRWWKLYSSQIANQGTHFLDMIRWATGDLGPVRIAALGGRFAVEDDRTIPDTMQATFENPSGRLVIFGQFEASSNPALPQPGYCELRGTQGTAYLSDSKIKILGERGGQFQDRKPRMADEEIKAADLQTENLHKSNRSITAEHARNFLDCMRSRALPNCDVEIGHRSTSYALLGNIALVTRSVVEWDPEKEVILNNPQASALMHYEYRKPWSLDG